MRISLFQVDAFAERLFEGNPAAVCPLPDWLPDAVLQSIAAENALSETAFLVGGGGSYALRWFTPLAEVPLCGHGTLASAHVVLERLEPGRTDVTFQTASGELTVGKVDGGLRLSLPTLTAEPVEPAADLAEAIGVAVTEVHATDRAYMAVFADEATVRSVVPDVASVAALGLPYLAVTAAGDDVDFVSRFFAPAVGVPEDPVTGSAHAFLAPFWAERLGKTVLRARQLSARGGSLVCEVADDRVFLTGRCVPYLEGTIHV